MDNINLRSEEFKEKLYELINHSNLPIANIYYIFKFIDQDLENSYNDYLKDAVSNLKNEGTKKDNKEEKIQVIE